MEKKTYTLTLEEGELAVIGAALAELPYKVSAGVMTNIGSQVNLQKNKQVQTDEQV